MKVKCPKCRLTFDVKTIPGITEVACNCPRCGTPFTYQLTEEEAAAAEKAAKEAVSVDGPQQQTPPKPTANDGASQSVASQAQPSYRQPQQNQAPASPSAHPSNGPYNYHGYREYPPQYMSQQRKFTSSCLGRAVISAVIMGFIILVINMCNGFSSDDLDNAAPVSKVDNTTPPDSKDDDDFVEVNAKEAPAWVQGTWTYNDTGNDGLGKITVVIRGNHLKEQINDAESAEGTFYYSNGVLHFESPDGSSRCDYRLNHKRKSIEWQDGKLMEKVN